MKPQGYPAASCAVKPQIWSEWRDSNSRHPGPKPGALPTGPHPDIELREIARCGQICGQRNSTTFLTNFQRRLYGVIAKLKGSMQHFGKSNRFGVPAPKAGALPTALHPDTTHIIHDRSRKCNLLFSVECNSPAGRVAAKNVDC